MIYLALAVLFLILQGFFSGMETGMVSLLRPRVEHEVKAGGKRAKKLLFFLDHSDIMIATTLVAINLSVVAASLMAKKFAEYCGIRGSAGLLLTTFILSILLLIMEIIPKDLFRQSPFKRCSAGVYALYTVYIVLYPVIRLFAAFTSWLNRAIGSENKNAETVHENFRLFLKESESAGSVDAQTAGILEKALKISSMTIKNLYIPKEKVLDIPITMTVREAFETAKKYKKDSLPVYFLENKNSDRENHIWCGIFNVYEAIYALDEALWETVEVKSCLSGIQKIRVDEDILYALKMSRSTKVRLFVVADQKDRQIGILSPDDLAQFLFKSGRNAENHK